MLLTRLLIALATLVALLPAQAQDAKRGEKQAAMCIGCHGIPGYQASFPEVYRVPKISDQNAKYIEAALQAYAKGDRKHPSMRGIGGTLTEQDMKDLAAFYASHGTPVQAPASVKPAPPEVAKLLAADPSQPGSQACLDCHGANFSKGKDDTYPKLAGQHADYLYVALKAYQEQGKATWGRSNGVMQGQVKRFTHPELKAIAKYLASLEGELQTVPQSRLR